MMAGYPGRVFVACWEDAGVAGCALLGLSLLILLVIQDRIERGRRNADISLLCRLLSPASNQ